MNFASFYQYNYIGAFRGGEYVLANRRDQQEGTRLQRQTGDATHFILGNDAMTFDTTSRSNFQGASKNDQTTPAAGKKEVVTDFDFLHLDMSENTEDMAPDPYAVSKQETLVARQLHASRKLPWIPVHKASLMQNDYTPMNKRK